jgi:hypothetical protein
MDGVTPLPEGQNGDQAGKPAADAAGFYDCLDGVYDRLFAYPRSMTRQHRGC